MILGVKKIGENKIFYNIVCGACGYVCYYWHSGLDAGDSEEIVRDVLKRGRLESFNRCCNCLNLMKCCQFCNARQKIKIKERWRLINDSRS